MLRLMNWDFLAFLAIVISPLLTFRGSYKDFLKYIGVPTSAEHIKSIKEALKQLEEREFIIYKEDTSTDEGYFVAAIVRSAECNMKTGINMIRKCKEIAENNNKRSWIPLLKVWIGVIEAEKNQPFTNEDIAKITGLSEYQIRESKKLLESNDIFKTKKEYIDPRLCLGQSVELNGFYNEQN